LQEAQYLLTQSSTFTIRTSQRKVQKIAKELVCMLPLFADLKKTKLG